MKLDCSAKDRTIEALRSQIDARKFVESQKAKVPGLRSVIKDQREELEWLHKKCPHRQVEDIEKPNGYKNAEKIPLISHFVELNHEDVEDLGDEVSRLNLNQRKLRRLHEENQNFRLDIGRLERENSELGRLRVEVLELNRELLETRSLQKTPADLDQSVSSTGLGDQNVLAVHRPLSED